MSGGVPAGELLPCPFCGGEAQIVGFRAPELWVACPATGCKASTEAFGSKERAIAAWNTRATPTPPIEGRDADVEREARFLLDRLVDHEVRMTSEQDAREWHGHVTPSMARLRAALQALGERG